MSEPNEDFDVMFYQLILSMQASAMQHLGKVMSPASGKIERNLEAARYSIDLLELIQRKTEGNLSEEEKKLLDHCLYELRLNFVEESKKPDEAPASDSAETGEKDEPAEAAPDQPEADEKD